MGLVPSSSSSSGTVVYPGTEIGYIEITSVVTVTSTNEADGTPIITPGAFTFDGAPVLCTLFLSSVSVAAGDVLLVCLFEAAVEIGRLSTFLDSSGVTGFTQTTQCSLLRFTPTAGSHTYSVTAFHTGGGASVNAGAGGTAAFTSSFLRFTKV